MAALSKAWVCGCSLGGIIGFEFRRDGCQCFRVLLGENLCVGLDRSSRGVLPSVVSECDREVLTMRRPWPTGGSRAIKKTDVFKIRCVEMPHGVVDQIKLSGFSDHISFFPIYCIIAIVTQHINSDVL